MGRKKALQRKHYSINTIDTAKATCYSFFMNKKIIIVDDDLYIRELYVEVFQDAGFTVDSSSDGEDALVKLKQGGYQLILIDVMMPKMNGLQVLQSLSVSPPLVQNGPAILLTNLSEDPLMNDPSAKLASAYIIKAEVTPDQIIKKAKELLGET
jgi:CheY-like chemotaxis protein